mmetsp:Transcript_39809/g.45385  ORF Transcript_39809/g.45385 Transcript_39809/m.45385 type:complete len:278 (+) Transcript_39809:45-878(+)
MEWYQRAGLLDHLFNFLSEKDIKSLFYLNKEWHQSATKSSIWKHRYLEKYCKHIIIDAVDESNPEGSENGRTEYWRAFFACSKKPELNSRLAGVGDFGECPPSKEFLTAFGQNETLGSALGYNVVYQNQLQNLCLIGLPGFGMMKVLNLFHLVIIWADASEGNHSKDIKTYVDDLEKQPDHEIMEKCILLNTSTLKDDKAEAERSDIEKQFGITTVSIHILDFENLSKMFKVIFEKCRRAKLSGRNFDLCEDYDPSKERQARETAEKPQKKGKCSIF